MLFIAECSHFPMADRREANILLPITLVERRFGVIPDLVCSDALETKNSLPVKKPGEDRL